jgi:hypothetical protein
VSYCAQAAEVKFAIRERNVPEGIEGMVRLFTVANGARNTIEAYSGRQYFPWLIA